MNTPVALAMGSIVVGILVLALKFLAYWVTGSVALYSDALESVVNVAASLAALVAIRVSAIPADRNHPYGHHKAEYFAAVLEGALIVVAALAIFREAYLSFLSPRAIEAPMEGIAISMAATAINAVWCTVLIRAGRARRSPALAADGRHLLADVVSSFGVWIGLALVMATGWLVIDPIVGCLVAVNILWSGWHLIRESVGGLMDAAPDPAEMDRIREIIAASGDGALEAHDLRTRHVGPTTFVEFHLVVPGGMAVSQAHDICDRIEAAIRAEMGRAVITIHVEPDEKAKHSGIVVL